jgi:hypothetical protein
MRLWHRSPPLNFRRCSSAHLRPQRELEFPASLPLGHLNSGVAKLISSVSSNQSRRTVWMAHMNLRDKKLRHVDETNKGGARQTSLLRH